MTVRRCIESRQCAGYVRRRYRLPDGRTVTSYEVFEPDINLADVRGFLAKAKGRRNLRPNKPRIPQSTIDGVLDDLGAGLVQREIAARRRVSARTIQRIKVWWRDQPPQ